MENAIFGLMVVALASIIWLEYRIIRQAKRATELLVSNTKSSNIQLNQIHKLVNSRLSEALQTIEDLKALLLLIIKAEVAADDPRIREAIAKNS